jgi:hypothetical protein
LLKGLLHGIRRNCRVSSLRRCRKFCCGHPRGLRHRPIDCLGSLSLAANPSERPSPGARARPRPGVQGPHCTRAIHAWLGTGRSRAPPSTRRWRRTGSRTSGGSERGRRCGPGDLPQAAHNRATTFGYDRHMIRVIPLLLSGLLAGCATASSPVASVDVGALCQELTKASASSPELIDKDYFANCVNAHGAKP